MAWQYGSVQRTDRRNWTLVDDKQMLEVHEKAGTDRECVTSTDSKTDEVLKAIEVSESEFFGFGKNLWRRTTVTAVGAIDDEDPAPHRC